MKQRSEENGSLNNDWETPEYIYQYIRKHFFKEWFDPCPLKSSFDGLSIEWGDYNYINPPYRPVKTKEAFIRKAYTESLKGKMCVMLIPANTDTKIFHEIIVPNAEVLFIKTRVKFKGYNTKGKYVTNATGQGGSMFVIFGQNQGKIRTVEIKDESRIYAR